MKPRILIASVATLVAFCLHASFAFAIPCTGGTCEGLPPEVGPQKFRMDVNGNKHNMSWMPDWINFNDDQFAQDNGDIVGIGWTNPGYQPNKTDPSFGDDSFLLTFMLNDTGCITSSTAYFKH